MPDHHPNDSNIDPDAKTLETAPEESSNREAVNWLAKAVAFAGEDHENIETYRAKLEEVSAQLKEPVQQ
jgi:hypothetical protein